MRAEYAFHSPFWDDISDSGSYVFSLIFTLMCKQAIIIIVVVVITVIITMIIVIIISIIIIKVTYTLQFGLNPVNKPLLKSPGITSPHIHFFPVDFIADLCCGHRN